MRVEHRLLSGTPLVEAWLGGSPAAEGFVPGPGGDPCAYLAKAREVDDRMGPGDRRLAASALAGGRRARGGAARGLRREGRLRRHHGASSRDSSGVRSTPSTRGSRPRRSRGASRRRRGRPVLPVFWIASEDHDWEEVRTTHVLDVRNRLREVAIPGRGPGPGNSIHRLRRGRRDGRGARAPPHPHARNGLPPEVAAPPRVGCAGLRARSPTPTRNSCTRFSAPPACSPRRRTIRLSSAGPFPRSSRSSRRAAAREEAVRRQGETIVGRRLRPPGPAPPRGDERLRRARRPARARLPGGVRLPPPGLGAPPHLPGTSKRSRRTTPQG